MKKVVMIRHGKKQGELIDPAQLTEIRVNGIPALNKLIQTDLRIVIGNGSGLERTSQTATAFMHYMESQGMLPYKVLASDSRFGNAELFSKMTGNTELMAEQKKLGWYNALFNVAPDFLTEIQQDEYRALEEIFDSIDDGELVITVGHTPMIELLALYIDSDDIIDQSIMGGLKELQGIEFQQNDGYISVVGYIG